MADVFGDAAGGGGRVVALLDPLGAGLRVLAPLPDLQEHATDDHNQQDIDREARSVARQP